MYSCVQGHMQTLLRGDHGADPAARGDVAFSDPHVPVFPPMHRHRFDLRSVKLTRVSLVGFNAVLVATKHDAFDGAMIPEHGRLIVDTRGVHWEVAGHVVWA